MAAARVVTQMRMRMRMPTPTATHSLLGIKGCLLGGRMASSSSSSSSWRDPEFLARVASTVSPPQLARFKKIYTEPFFLMNASIRDNGVMRFAVSGSTATQYVLELSPETGRMRCSCKDACMNCHRLGYACKHVCFVLYRVLRLDDDLAFFRDELTVSEAHRAAIAQRIQTGANELLHPPATITPDEVDRMCDHLAAVRSTGPTIRRRTHSFLEVARPPTEADECPVCYDLLLRHGAELRGCPDCGNAIHKLCVDRWLACAARRSCVYCRSTVWSAYS